MKKKLTACVLVMALAFTMCVPAFTAEDARLQRAQLEIEQQVEAAMDAASYALSQIDPRYTEAYRILLTNQITRRILAEYGIAISTSSQTYNLPEGGAVTYEWTDPSGNKYYIGVTLLDSEDTDAYLTSRPDNSFNAYTILGLILTFASFRSATAGIFGSVFSIYSALGLADRQEIIDAGGYALLRNVYLEGLPMADGFSYVEGWYDYPEFTPDDGAVNVKVFDASID